MDELESARQRRRQAEGRVADAAWREVEANVDKLIRDGHRKAAELNYDRNALTIWFLENDVRGRELRRLYAQGQHRRHGGPLTNEPR